MITAISVWKDRKLDHIKFKALHLLVFHKRNLLNFPVMHVSETLRLRAIPENPYFLARLIILKSSNCLINRIPQNFKKHPKPSQILALKMHQILVEERTKHGKKLSFTTAFYGKVLWLTQKFSLIPLTDSVFLLLTLDIAASFRTSTSKINLYCASACVKPKANTTFQDLIIVSLVVF